LDIRHPLGKEIYCDLVKKVDVVVENLRPGSVDKLGIGYKDLKQINPHLVYAAISGFGRLEGFQGPEGNRPAFDIVAEAMSGIMHLVGFADKPPSWTLYGMADIYTGLCAAFGILQALFMRERTGEGQFVDSAMLDAMVSLNERMIMLYSLTGVEPERGRLKHLYPRGAFKCKDGYLALNVPDDIIWARLCRLMGREDLIEDKRCVTGTSRATHADFICPIIEDWLAPRMRQELENLLNENGIPTGPVYTAKEVFESPQLKARKMLVTISDPEVGTYTFSRGPVILSSAPELQASPAPRLGEHSRDILMELLHYEGDHLKYLEQEGAIYLSD